MSTSPAPATYEVQAQSTDTFGRVLCQARHHHFVVDGPARNGCPGEALLPPELFLAGVAACGVELVQVIARGRQTPLRDVQVQMTGLIDRGRPVRPDLTLFNQVRIDFRLGGVGREEAEALVADFKAR